MIFGCVGSSFLRKGFSLVAASGGHSSSRCAGLSLSRPLLLRSTGSRRAGSVVVAHGARLLRGMRDLPRPGLEPVSPASAGRFSTTVPPGKPEEGPLISVQGQAIWPSPCIVIRLIVPVASLEKASNGTSKSVQVPIFRLWQHRKECLFHV